MKYIAALAAGIAIASAGHAQDQTSEIQVQKVDDGSYVVVLRSMTSKSVAAAQQELLPEARRLCGARSARFGKYQFEQYDSISPNAKPVPFRLKQEIRCVAAASVPPRVVAPDPNWRPSAEQQRAVLAMTERFFRLKDAGDYQQVRTFVSEAFPFDHWLAAAEKFNKQSGELRQRTIQRVTWYKDRPDAPLPGVYVAVDFSGQFTNLEIYCGYLVWHEGQDGTFRLTRQEENYWEIHPRTTANELEAARKKLGC